MSFRKKLADEKATGYKYVSLSSIRKQARKGLKKGERWKPTLSAEQPDLHVDVVFRPDDSPEGTWMPKLWKGCKKLDIVWRRADGKKLDRPLSMSMAFVPPDLPPNPDRVGHLFGCYGMDEFRRFRKAVRDGLVFLRPKVAIDVSGRTYVHIGEDLIAPLSGKFRSVRDLLEFLGR